MVTNEAFKMARRCDTGCLRTFNEDAVGVRPDIGLMVVADGMGGHNAGDVAARIAVDAIEEQVRAALAESSDTPPGMSRPLRQAFDEADRRMRIASQSGHGRERMGCTVAAVLLYNNHAHIAHIGDTRVYLLRDGKLSLLTRDHSPSQRISDAGLVDDKALSASHNRHLVSQALGVGHDAAAVEIKTLPLTPGDVLLACSDGLNDMVDGTDIELVLDTMVDNVELAAEQLVMVARDCGGHDNISVAVARIDAPFPASAAVPGRVASGGKPLFARLRSWFART